MRGNHLPLIVYKFAGAIAGLFLFLFLIVHLYGNFYLLAGERAYNLKSAELISNPLVRLLEILLIIAFIVHITAGVVLTASKWRARTQKYRLVRWQTPFYKRFAWLTGTVVLLFLVVHLLDYTVPYRITGEVTNLYQEVAEHFSDPLFTAFYLVAFAFLGYHLLHGADSMIQTFGVTNRKIADFLKSLGKFLAVLITLGYMFLAVYMYLKHA